MKPYAVFGTYSADGLKGINSSCSGCTKGGYDAAWLKACFFIIFNGFPELLHIHGKILPDGYFHQVLPPDTAYFYCFFN